MIDTDTRTWIMLKVLSGLRHREQIIDMNCVGARLRRAGGEGRHGETSQSNHATRQTSSHAMAERTLASSQRLYESYNAPKNELPASGMPSGESADTWAATDVDAEARRSARLPALARTLELDDSRNSSIAGAGAGRDGQMPAS